MLLLVVAYNNVCNRWPPFNGPLYVPINVLATGVLTLIALGALELSPDELGLSGSSPRGLGAGVVIGIVASAPLFLFLGHPRGARLLADRRVEGLSGRALAFQILVRVPLGTVMLEEVAFRGVILALLGGSDRPVAIAVSSVAFGFWHVAPTINLVAANRPHASNADKRRAVAGAVAFTALAGIALAGLRFASGGLAGPIGVHATVNGLGTLAAVAAHRKSASARVR